MGRRHRVQRGRVTPKGTHPGRSRPTGPPAPDEELDLLADVRVMLASGHPHELLTAGSHLVEFLTERPIDKLRRGEPTEATEPSIVEAFLEADLPETTALLCAMAPLLSDELLAVRIRRAVGRRTHALPAWVWSLDRVEIAGTWVMTHILGDGDNVMIGARWPTGHEATAVIYVDHNMGTVVKDAFIVPEGIVPLVRRFRELSDSEAGGETTIAPIDSARARAMVTAAITTGEMYLPPFETETWPACRSAVEWLTAHLPEGGIGYERPDWTDEARAGLARAFFASEEGAPLAGEPALGDLLDSVMWFGCDYGAGDPLRWSPVVCEILLTDWFPRKIVAPAADLAGLPALLRRFIVYAHRQRGIPASLTAETLAAVDEYEDEYQAVIRTDRAQGAEAIALAALRMGGFDGISDSRQGFEERLLDGLAEAVGGADVLASLEAVPLPDEPFDWDDVPADIRPRVAIVLGLVERCCDELLDVEYRTVCRRLLHRAASGGPQVFRRRSRDEHTAAAIVWLAGKANDLFTVSGGQMFVKDLLAWFGIMRGSVAQRASGLRKAAGLPAGAARWFYDVTFGDPALLTSSRRSTIIEIRDRYASLGLR
jgi:hypothetical protein